MGEQKSLIIMKNTWRVPKIKQDRCVDKNINIQIAVIERGAVNILIRTLNISEKCIFERVKLKPAVLLPFHEELQEQQGSV